MALPTALGELAHRLETLRDGLLGLRLILVEDRPVQGAGALLDRLGEAALDLEQWVGEALAAARRGRSAGTAGEALSDCQQPFQRFQRQLTAEIVSFDRIEEIAALGRERGGEWVSWVRGVRSAVDQCQAATHDANDALFQCWQETQTASLERTRNHGPHHQEQ